MFLKKYTRANLQVYVYLLTGVDTKGVFHRSKQKYIPPLPFIHPNRLKTIKKNFAISTQVLAVKIPAKFRFGSVLAAIFMLATTIGFAQSINGDRDACGGSAKTYTTAGYITAAYNPATQQTVTCYCAPQPFDITNGTKTGSSSGSVNVQWNASGTGKVKANYLCTATSGSFGFSSSTSINVNLYTLISISGPLTIACNDGNTTYSIVPQPGATYQWSRTEIITGSGLDFAFGTSTTGNSVIIANSNNSTAGQISLAVSVTGGPCGNQTASITISKSFPDNSINGNNTICYNQTKGYTAFGPVGSGYVWSATSPFVVSSQSGTTCNVLAPGYSTSGVVRVTFTDVCGNSRTLTKPISSGSSCSARMAALAPADSSVKIFPNPVADILKINNRAADVYEVRLYNRLQKLVRSAKSSNAEPLQLNVKTLPEGLYFLQVSDGQGNLTQKRVLIKR